MWVYVVAVVILTAYSEGVSELDCDFERDDLCNYTIEIDHTPGLYDVLEWRRGEAVEKQKYYDIKLLTFGPDGDHTTGASDGNFMYAVRPINPNTITTMVSPEASGRICYLEFFYHMGSRSLNKMTAYVIKYGDKIKLWSIEGYQGRDWQRALIDIEKYTEFGNYQIAIEVNEPNDAYWTVGYAVDDIRGIGCNMAIDCNFEKDMCNFEVQQNSSMFDPMHWARGQTKTKTWFGQVNTLKFGPKSDHTTGAKNGYFAYAQETWATNTATGLLSPKQLDPLCHVSFWYYMNASTLTSLSFHVRRDGYDFQIWEVTGDQGNQWNYIELPIENMTRLGSYELVWWAKEPEDKYWTVGYAIDDVKTYQCACNSDPCKNGGHCFSEFQNYTCLCPRYFEGQSCERNTNPCRNAPCKNLAACSPVDTNYTCACWPGWTGQDCDVDIDDCASSPCQRGTCEDELNSFTCHCPPGYKGEFCETEIDECESIPCQYAGNCTDGLNSFTCDCMPGYTGKQCETNINECLSAPCQHNGYCFDYINRYYCICRLDYAGEHCEIRKQMDCDFEKDFCGYTVSSTDTPSDSSNDTLDWERGVVSTPGFFGSTRILYMGPRVDHTLGEVDGSAAYAKHGQDSNATTTMLSPLMEGRLCYLEFFYHMGSSVLNDLDVYLIKDGKRNHVFNANGYQGFEWQRAMVDIEEYTETGQYQLSFEVDEPNPSGASDLLPGYAIDDIKGFNCDLSIDCDFENDTTCNYIIERDNDYFDRMEWRRGQAQLETVFFNIKLLRNGPGEDHTTNKSSGHFMYAVKPINSGTNTTLVAPRQRDQMCFLQFYYHMGSHYLNNLMVDIRGENETFTVFNATGYQGDDWNRALIDISDETKEGKYEIAFFVNEPSDQVWTVGYAIDDISSSICECDTEPCMNGGECTNLYKDFTCTCPYLYSGKQCETRLTPCELTPCDNGGSCTDLPDDDFRCACVEGWTGKNCTEDVDECESSPCLNYAVCNDNFNSYTCDCAPGWYGTHCEENINECLSGPCQNKAICVDQVNFYECDCAPGYFGVYCQFNIDECASDPCMNGGTCSDDVNFYSCTCPPGYTGTNCEREIDECDSSPCQNNGLCMDRIARYDCYCRPGFTGSYCAVNVNECWSSPCQNGASCVDEDNAYSCACAQGFTGEHCETEINECDSSPCRNGGTCTDEIGRFTCDCPIHWAGDMCEKALTDCGTDPC